MSRGRRRGGCDRGEPGVLGLAERHDRRWGVAVVVLTASAQLLGRSDEPMVVAALIVVPAAASLLVRLADLADLADARERIAGRSPAPGTAPDRRPARSWDFDLSTALLALTFPVSAVGTFFILIPVIAEPAGRVRDPEAGGQLLFTTLVVAVVFFVVGTWVVVRTLGRGRLGWPYALVTLVLVAMTFYVGVSLVPGATAQV